jgi:magnesium transporter
VPALHELEGEADAIEDQVFATQPCSMQETLRRIGIARQNVMDLIRILGDKADILHGFTKRCSADYQGMPNTDLGLYYSDIQDHVVTTVGNLTHLERMLSRSQSNALTQLSIDRISQRNDINRALGRVMVLVTVMVSLYTVYVLFGMNVRVPWERDSNLRAFFGIVGVVTLIAVVALWAARRIGCV